MQTPIARLEDEIWNIILEQYAKIPVDDIEEMLVQDGQQHDNQDARTRISMLQDNQPILTESKLSSTQATHDERKS